MAKASDGEPIAGALRGQQGLQALPIMSQQSMPFPILGVGVDVDGTVYVTETQRQAREEISLIQSGQTKVQANLLQEHCMSLTSTEMKERFIREHFSPAIAARQGIIDFNGDGDIDFEDLRVRSENIYTLQDSDGDGVFDQATLFADGFNSAITGVAHSVTPIDGHVYATIIPDLWKLTDTDGDSVADQRESLALGFAPHIGYGNHDLHSVIKGYDGKLYWSMGDRGANITTRDGRQVSNPHSGCVLRCNPDGSDMEVFASGLRNCQCIDFDDYGNLFSIDHDADFQGESERLVYLPEGSDSGWRMYYQYRQDTGLTSATRRDLYHPWLDEKMWIPFHAGQPSHILPPIENSWNAPASFSYQPATALGGKYAGHFLVGLHGEIRAFRMMADGATFKREADEVVVGALGSQVLSSTFAPDGRLYFTLWRPADGKSQLWALQGEETTQASFVNQLLAGGTNSLSIEQLLELLSHVDRRVRQQAQFELVKRQRVDELVTLAANPQVGILPRLHSLWGLGQLEHRDSRLLAALLCDESSEIRAQTARWSGELRFDPDNLIAKLLLDDSPRVRLHAAIACGKLASRDSFSALCDLIEKANNDDPVLRHAAVLGLSGTATPLVLQGLSGHSSEAVRIAAVSALRRQGAAVQLAKFLNDPSPQVRSDTVRAIYDDATALTFEQHPTLLKQLARLLDANEPVAVNVRAIAANRRLGGGEAAMRITQVLDAPQLDSTTKLQALYALQSWTDTSMLDPVDGRYFPVEQGSEAALRDAIGPELWKLAGSEDKKISELAIAVLGKSSPSELETQAVLQTILDESQSNSMRIGWLSWLQVVDSEQFAVIGPRLLASSSPIVRSSTAAKLRRASLAYDAVETYLGKALRESTDIVELQRVIELVPTISAKVDIVKQLLEKFDAGVILPEVELELFEVAEKCAELDSGIGQWLKEYQSAANADDPLAAYSVALHGGDPESGHQLFRYNSQLQCTKCH
ncbi:MAG: HEAT repeat domain-containing protein, partial [Rubripirellula sp.]|nr:HEAT repeat domain-containing protein [Rubripirellula sp.]